ncbi:hypothetical protein E2562_028479 [Oryza meyeriana var. granulata]|uniref:Exocyst subunit Exo70 family protein n=1 Tax=Oryza meyeriana var. granulata TaxID=110450 RepID=A0A6G1E454_9ORYZ|nr:hypothetical protein E2562_028479 [Oryza meyeriana var. granulata]
MALRLDVVSASAKLDDDLSAAADPRPCISYRDSIRSVVAVSGGLLFQSVNSTRTGSCSSYSSDFSGHSSGVSAAASAGFWALRANELREIARRMVTDDYAQRMVQSFDDAATVDDVALERWFFELDVDWVLLIREGQGLRQLEQSAASWALHDLVGRWIRALTIMVQCFSELGLAADEPTPALARFGEASIAKMVVFVDAVLAAFKVYAPAEKLHAVVNMYGHAMDASSLLSLQWLLPQETQSRFDDMEDALFSKVKELHDAISCTMEEAKTLVEADDDSTWEMEMARGRGEVHRNTRLMVDCIVSLGMYEGYLYAMIDDAIGYLKNLIRRKSKLCPDQKPEVDVLAQQLPFRGAAARAVLQPTMDSMPMGVYR